MSDRTSTTYLYRGEKSLFAKLALEQNRGGLRASQVAELINEFTKRGKRNRPMTDVEAHLILRNLNSNEGTVQRVLVPGTKNGVAWKLSQAGWNWMRQYRARMAEALEEGAWELPEVVEEEANAEESEAAEAVG